MNNDRRKRIQDAIAILQYVLDEEQEAYDNMPESLQSSERGDNSQSAIDALDTAIGELEGIE